MYTDDVCTLLRNATERCDFAPLENFLKEHKGVELYRFIEYHKKDGTYHAVLKTWNEDSKYWMQIEVARFTGTSKDERLKETIIYTKVID